MHQNPYYRPKQSSHQRWDRCSFSIHIPTNKLAFLPACFASLCMSWVLSGVNVQPSPEMNLGWTLQKLSSHIPQIQRRHQRLCIESGVGWGENWNSQCFSVKPTSAIVYVSLKGMAQIASGLFKASFSLYE